jgi:glutathione S-transferase
VDKVTLHCCNFMWIKPGHACARVRKALDDAGVPYEMVHHPHPRGRREDLRAKTGQNLLPAIEFADGHTYREESKDMAARIAAGKLAES